MKAIFKKKWFLIALAILIIGGSGTAFALSRGNTPNNPPTKRVEKSTQTYTQEKLTETADESTQTTTPVATTQQAPVENNTVTIPVPSEQVDEKTTMMNDAGIPADQQSAADAVITKLSNWTHKDDGTVNLCMATPAAKMAKFGSDYLTNPVTQLKYCNDYAINRYGSWSDWH